MYGRKSTRNWARVSLGPFLPIFIGASAAPGAVIYVDASATGASDGTSWCNAFIHVQDAMAVAQPGDEIRVAAGIYMPDGGYQPVGGAHVSGSGDRTATFRLKVRVNLFGGYAGCGAPDPDERDFAMYPTALRGDLNGNDGLDFLNYADNSYHVVTYDDPNATGVLLDGFTISGGNADGPDAPANQGGGIHIRNGLDKCIPGGPTIRNCVIENNWADHHGAINDHGLSTRIENCIIRNNFAGEQGAGLLVHHGRDTSVQNCTFGRNVTANEGGAVWTGRDSDSTCPGTPAPRFEDCRFVGNEGFNGGGLFADEFSSPVVVNCDFEENRAEFQGGGLHLALGGIAISNTRFRQNAAGVDVEAGTVAGGGGVWLGPTAGKETTLVDCEFRENIARRGGGAFSHQSSSIRVLRGLFEDNAATSGGALWYGGEAVVTSCTFFHNEATAGGGALASNVDGDLTLTRSFLIENAVVENTAGGGGGGLFVYGGSLAITNCWFIGNSFDPSSSLGLGGGGILVNSDAFATIANTVLLNNFAYTGGGAAFSNFATVNVVNCTFAGNRATFRGDGIAAWNSSLTVTNSVLWDAHEAGSNVELAVLADPQPVVAYNCIKGGWSGLENLDVDPRFVDVSGTDGIVGTADDDLRLQFDSPCVDLGTDANLPNDTIDLDGDGKLDEPMPLDLDENPRAVGARVDAGAFEMQFDCNANRIHDDQDIAGGNSEDLNDDGIPDECELLPPVVGPSGSRALVLAVQSPSFAVPLDLEITSPDYPCLLQYAQTDARLGDEPVFQTPEAWGSVAVTGRDIVPLTAYQIRLISEDGLLEEVVDTVTARWGDTAGQMVEGQSPPPDGQVTIGDLVACISTYLGRPEAPPIPLCDLDPEIPDGAVRIADLVRIVDALLGRPYPFSLPDCP